MKNISLLILLLLALSFSISAQRKRPTVKPTPKPTPKAVAPLPQTELITTRYDQAKDQTTVSLKYRSAVLGPNQSFFLAADYFDTDPDSLFFSILSVATNFRYAEYKDIKILVDGERLSYGSERLARLLNLRDAKVGKNGEAMETLSVILTIDELSRIASARRVDISVFTDSFVLGPQNLAALKEFLTKIEPVRTKGLAKKQEKEKPPPSACPLTLDKSPEIKGIRLGMSTREIIPRFSSTFGITGNKVNMDGVDVIIYAFYDFGGGGTLPKLKEWENVKYVRFQFLDDKLLVFEIHYTGKGLNLWKDTDSFVKLLSGTMTLPSPLVTYKPSKEFGSDDSTWAFCQGWTMEFNANGAVGGGDIEGKVKLTNTAVKSAYLKDVEDKKRQEEERKRLLFKP